MAGAILRPSSGAVGPVGLTIIVTPWVAGVTVFLLSKKNLTFQSVFTADWLLSILFLTLMTFLSAVVMTDDLRWNA
jgi:hypothetical protein